MQGGSLLPDVTGPGRLQLIGRREAWTAERAAVEADTSRSTAGATYYWGGHSRKVQGDYTVKRETPELANDEMRLSLVLVF